MSTVPSSFEPPSNRKLVRATLIAFIVAAVLLVSVVMPAEYGIDPLGIGKRLGLTVLAPVHEDTGSFDLLPASAAVAPLSADNKARNEGEAAKAAQAFGASDKQTFAAEALAPTQGIAKPESLTLSLAPGKGAEVKTLLKAGQGIVFNWKASDDVAVDMHGERTGVKGAWTSYSVEAAQREAAGTFTAPFDGSHGWYWENRSKAPVDIKIDVAGFQEALYQP